MTKMMQNSGFCPHVPLLRVSLIINSICIKCHEQANDMKMIWMRKGSIVLYTKCFKVWRWIDWRNRIVTRVRNLDTERNIPTCGVRICPNAVDRSERFSLRRSNTTNIRNDIQHAYGGVSTIVHFQKLQYLTNSRLLHKNHQKKGWKTTSLILLLVMVSCALRTEASSDGMSTHS